jgi:hypothetical protein
LNKFENHTNYNCTITLESGEKYNVYANWIHNQKLDQWQGWHCNAGHTRFYIDKNFDIWSGECKNNYLGNVTDAWNLKTDTMCNRDTCTSCTDDLLTHKHEK